MPDRLTKEQRAELRKLAEAATPVKPRLDTTGWHADARFEDAANPAAVLSLLDALDAAEEENERDGFEIVQLREELSSAGKAADDFVGDGLQIYTMKRNGDQSQILMCKTDHWTKFLFALCRLKEAARAAASASGEKGGK